MRNFNELCAAEFKADQSMRVQISLIIFQCLAISLETSSLAIKINYINFHHRYHQNKFT